MLESCCILTAMYRLRMSSVWPRNRQKLIPHFYLHISDTSRHLAALHVFISTLIFLFHKLVYNLCSFVCWNCCMSFIAGRLVLWGAGSGGGYLSIATLAYAIIVSHSGILIILSLVLFTDRVANCQLIQLVLLKSLLMRVLHKYSFPLG